MFGRPPVWSRWSLPGLTRRPSSTRDAELELWTRAGHIKVKLHKKLDIRRIDQLIAWAVLK